MLYPIVQQIGLSAEQVPAVLQRGKDVAVTAAAGAGKTLTLVARYVAVLAEFVPLRSIVAITFTRKAAREMRNRIRQEMRRYLSRIDLTESERERWQQLYGELDAARIGTIHSLCTEILRQHPAEAGIDPRFGVLEEGQANILRDRAVGETLSWAANEEDVVRLFSLLRERPLRATVDSLLRRRLEAEEAFRDLPHDLLGHWSRALDEGQRSTLDKLEECEAWRDAVATLRATNATDPNDRMGSQRRQVLAAIATPAAPLSRRLDALTSLGSVRLTGGSARNWPGGRNDVSQVKAALRTLRGLWRSQERLLTLQLTPLDESLTKAMPPLQALFRHAVARYQRLKDERNALDFDDLEQGALSLLNRDPSVRHRWQEEIQAILVDEFQDTNSRQRDLVQCLNGAGGKLFIVGDAKQSIYRFRGADVTVFRGLRQEIQNQDGVVYSLDTTFRAHKGLVQGLNGLLRPVLGTKDDPSRPWAEPFSPLKRHREQPGPGFVSPHIELHLGLGTKSAGGLDLAADGLAGRIVALVESADVQVAEAEGFRPIGYGDVAILCRASTSFAAYEDALERAGVPFLTVAGRGFYDRPEIRDLLNVLRTLGDPTDDLALVGTLRSPAFGLSDEALYWLCAAWRQTAPSASLWQAIRGSDGCVPKEELGRLRRAAGIIERLQQRAGRTVIADLLKAFLDATDYCAGLMQGGQHRAVRNVAKLLSDAHASGIVSVGEFLEYVGELRGTGAREGEARATSEGVVQIMSVHAAKGLEFPIVVIGDVTYGYGSRPSLLLSPDLGVLLPLRDDDDQYSASFMLGKALEEDQEAAEEDRLLYVAATRASEKLLISGCVSLKRNGGLSSPRGWLAKIAGPECLGWETISYAEKESSGRAITFALEMGRSTDERVPVSCTLYEPGWRWDGRTKAAAPSVHEIATTPPPLLSPVHAGEAALDRKLVDQATMQRVWRVVPRQARRRAPGWVIGILVHKALAAWRFPDEGFEAWALAKARGLGIVDRQQLRHAMVISRQLLLRFRRHPLWQEMDSAHKRYHEVPYTLLVEDRMENGVIDALFQRDGRWTIVEFKTDHVRNREKFMALLRREDYLTQVERYARAVHSLLGQRPRVALCMLDYGGRVRAVTDLSLLQQ